MTEDYPWRGLTGLIHCGVDQSFRPRCMIAFIRPEPRPIDREMPGAAPLEEDDVEPAPIDGPRRLVDAPAVETVAIDERGFPTPTRAAAPRFRAAHKLWPTERDDRDPQKTCRDRREAFVVLEPVAARLRQPGLDENVRRTLPGAPRPPFEMALERIARPARGATDGD